MKIIKKCDYCNKPMGNSQNIETDAGELEVWVHVKCVRKWAGRQLNILNQMEVNSHKN